MKVVLARTAGFCIGVKRALEMVLKAINENQTKIYTYGPLIHNPQVLELLKERGITVLQPGETAAEGIIMSKKSALRDNFVAVYHAQVDRLQDKPYFVNFRNILCSRTEPVYQPDGIHLQDVGRKIMAQHFNQVLKDRLVAGKTPGQLLAGMPPESHPQKSPESTVIR